MPAMKVRFMVVPFCGSKVPREQNIVALSLVQMPCSGRAEVSMEPFGMGLVIATEVADEGPRLVTEMV